MKDCLSSSINDTSRIVEDSGELMKACIYFRMAADKVFQNDGHQSYWAETLTKGKCIIVC